MSKYLIFVAILLSPLFWRGIGGEVIAQTFTFDSLQGGLSFYPNAMCVYKNELYVTGVFKYANSSLVVNGICRWNGNQWNKVSGGLDHSSASCFAVHNNILYLGGVFQGVLDTNGNIINSSKLIGWDGSNWIPLSLNNNYANEEVEAIAEFQGNLYICGQVLHIGSLAVNRIAKWDGVNWHDIGVNVIDSFGPPQVDAMAVFNNELYVGGCFCKINNVFVNNIARWDGLQWHPVDIGVQGCVTSLYTDSVNNVLWAGGGIVTAGGIPTTGVAVWNGLLWSVPGQPVTCGSSDITKYNNCIFNASPYCGTVQSELSYWNGSAWYDIPQITDYVSCLAEYQGFLYLGGVFPGFPNYGDYILKMQMITGVAPIDIEKKNLLKNNIPNPFSITTTIPYQLHIGTKEAHLNISNIFGKLIKTINLDLQKTDVEINMQNLSGGVYSYSLVLDGKVTETKKMVLVK